MSKEEMLRIMRLLSALESVTLLRTEHRALPVYLLEELTVAVDILEREILK
jgi:hypothetical protein